MLIRRFSGEYTFQGWSKSLLIAATISLLCLSDSISALPKMKRPAFSRQTRQESDKEILFRALEEIGNGRYGQGRALLKPLIVPDNPLMSVAILITADSCYREGGSRNSQEAEIQYRTWLESFPRDDLAPQVLLKLAEMHLRQYNHRDGDGEVYAERVLQRLRTEYPEFQSSEAVDYLDVAQEIRADHNLKVARFYDGRDYNPMAAGMRCSLIVDKWPRFTKMDEALWYLAIYEEADENIDGAIKHYGRIVRDHPNSVFRNRAENRLICLGGEVPESDPLVGVELSKRSARIARVLESLRGDPPMPRRGILLNEWDQVDSVLMYEMTSRIDR